MIFHTEKLPTGKNLVVDVHSGGKHFTADTSSFQQKLAGVVGSSGAPKLDSDSEPDVYKLAGEGEEFDELKLADAPVESQAQEMPPVPQTPEQRLAVLECAVLSLKEQVRDLTGTVLRLAGSDLVAEQEAYAYLSAPTDENPVPPDPVADTRSQQQESTTILRYSNQRMGHEAV